VEAPSKPKQKVLRLVKRRPDKTIIDYINELQKVASTGELVGVMIAAHHGGTDFRYMGAGTLAEVPTLGVGAAVRLAQKML
jgi:hypothetical protein